MRVLEIRAVDSETYVVRVVRESWLRWFGAKPTEHTYIGYYVWIDVASETRVGYDLSRWLTNRVLAYEAKKKYESFGRS
jgi:hypothetical protein